MLYVKDLPDKPDPVRCTRLIRGAEVVFWLRPWDADVARKMRKRHVRGFEWTVNPSNGRKEKTEVLNDEAFLDEMLDYVLASFEGVGNSAGNPWPSDLEHKKKLVALSVEKGDTPIYEWLLEEAQGLAFADQAVIEEQEKN